MSIIDIKNISKYYGSTEALNDVSIKIEPNKIYGLLGKNGAGKTTLLNLMTNRIFPTGGQISIDGQNVIENDEALEKVFYMPENNLYPDSMTVKNVFNWTKEFYTAFDIDYALSLCDKFNLDPKKKLKSLSTGYSSISKLITTLSSHATILLFDEPVLGLDANHRDLFYKELLSNYIDKPKTIIISTHIIEEISDILERVIILRNKKIFIDENVEKLLSQAYCISGSSLSLDKYIEGKNCIDISSLGAFKAAIIKDMLSNSDKDNAKELNLEFTKVSLQKLYIHLTNESGVEK